MEVAEVRGGGAYILGGGGVINPGAIGYLNNSFFAGNQGTTGSTSGSAPYNGGNGGNCYNSTFISLPFTNSSPLANAYFGNAAGGGGGYVAGNAGYSSGGSGGSGNFSPTANTNGENSHTGLQSSNGNFYYGNGGGGGASNSFPNGNFGGSGSNGVVMLWWQN